MAAFYLDENIPERLANALAGFGHDAISTNRLGRKGASDPAQLTTAADLGRILVTHNESDFGMLHEAWLRFARRWHVSAERSRHFGILAVRQAIGLTVQEMASALSEFVAAGETLENRMIVLTRSGWRPYEPITD